VTGGLLLLLVLLLLLLLLLLLFPFVAVVGGLFEVSRLFVQPLIKRIRIVEAAINNFFIIFNF